MDDCRVIKLMMLFLDISSWLNSDLNPVSGSWYSSDGCALSNPGAFCTSPRSAQLKYKMDCSARVCSCCFQGHIFLLSMLVVDLDTTSFSIMVLGWLSLNQPL